MKERGEREVDNLLYRSEAICPRVKLLGYANQSRDFPVRAKLLLFTLTALAGFGQNANMVGLPEYGVTLSGTLDNPKLTMPRDATS
jgi:hypothetical protein